MGQTSIEWCDYTFNPWRGCTKVSPGCTHCYAETMSKRNPSVFGEWGPQGKRVIAANSYWRQPFKWDREAAAAGERRRVFCASLADVFEDRPELDAPLARLWRTIIGTPWLDWLLLTKRPECIIGRLKAAWAHLKANLLNDGCLAAWIDGSHPPENVWLGVSVEDQQRADERIPLLLQTPAAVRFLSCEPLLGAVDVKWAMPCEVNSQPPHYLAGCYKRRIDWLIVGGESGPHARPMSLAWARSLVRQCREAGVACFVKQLGAKPMEEMPALGLQHLDYRDPKGGSPEEWPDDLRVRQWPETKGGAS